MESGGKRTWEGEDDKEHSDAGSAPAQAAQNGEENWGKADESGKCCLGCLLGTLAPRPAPFLCFFPRLAGLFCSHLSMHAHGGAALRMDAQMRAETKARQLREKGKERCGARGKGAKQAARGRMGVRTRTQGAH